MRRRIGPIVLAVVALPPLMLGMIVWHELGHTVAALLLGDPTARFSLVDAGHGCFGCNLYDSASLAPLPNAIVNAAGVLATQLLAWAAVLLLARRPRAVVAVLLGDLAFATIVGDLVWQPVQAALAGPYDPVPLGTSTTYVDGSAVVWFLHAATGMSQMLVAAILVAATTLDLGLLLAVLVLGRRRAPAPR